MTHPNKFPFTGVLTVVDAPSDKAPSGARGHRVILTDSAARTAIPTLIGMGINFASSGKKHNPESKVGIIEHAEIQGWKAMVSGYVFGRDCPTVISQLNASADYGMSYEIADAHVEDMRAEVWKLTRVTFTGASILPREHAAYRLTEFSLVSEGKR